MRQGHEARLVYACIISMFAAASLSFSTFAQVLLTNNFETDPMTQGWMTNGTGTASWTTDQSFSGTHSLACASGGTWLSPMLPTTPLQWYRFSFKTLAPGTVNNPGSIGYAYWGAQFFDGSGNLLTEDQYSAVFQSGTWVTNEFRIRAKNLAGPNATLVPVQMQIRFQSISPQLYVDDVVLETTTLEEVARWGDAQYDIIPAKLAYVPKADRWAHLPLTMNRLRTGQNLRIVMLGDSVEQDTANAPWDAWLARLYPGASIQVISSTRGGTGVNYFASDVPFWVTAYQPDLLCIGGIDNPDDMSYFQTIVNQVRADNAANHYTTEFLLLTEQWSPNIQAGQFSFLAPGITELDQVPANNPGGVPSGYRGDLLNFCYANSLEYLDLTGVACQFVYGAAAAGGVGPPDVNGNPYSYWMRDYTHSSDHGKLIQGRMLEAFFAPAPTPTITQTGTNLTLAWPLASTGYYLQSATNLAVTNTAWSSNATALTITNGQNVVIVNPTNSSSQTFFRLVKSL